MLELPHVCPPPRQLGRWRSREGDVSTQDPAGGFRRPSTTAFSTHDPQRDDMLTAEGEAGWTSERRRDTVGRLRT